MEKVCLSEHLSLPQRRPTVTVQVGELTIGSQSPVRLQSMASVDTNQVEDAAQQARRIAEAGAELIRFTTQGQREVASLAQIRQQLADIKHIPLVADVHFNAPVADAAAAVVEKVRINPGNYIDAARKFQQIDYTDQQYAEELHRLEQRLTKLIAICKEHHTALRIGVNHGSLSDRIMSRYGNTEQGMVEAAMEFLRICHRAQFDQVVVSMKASDPALMYRAVCLLVDQMDAEDLHYPLHLGVTEAGEGADGRLRSVIGIGALLTRGIGDTIRVSLSEAPEKELPVARWIVDYIFNPASTRYDEQRIISDYELPLEECEQEQVIVFGKANAGNVNVLCYISDTADKQQLAMELAIDIAAPLFSGEYQALQLVNPHITWDEARSIAFDILQAAGILRTRTEYISCPSCGRTLFDLEKAVHEVKAATAHLSRLKIAVMGCIVNGPGEMADADYGYVGAGRGKVSLYKGKECVVKNIPETEAVEALVQLIKANGDWQ